MHKTAHSPFNKGGFEKQYIIKSIHGFFKFIAKYNSLHPSNKVLKKVKQNVKNISKR